MNIHDKLAQIAKQAAAARAGTGVTVSSRTIGRLDAGTHTVRVDAVDTGLLTTRGWVDITFGDAADNTHRERIWVLARDGVSLSYGTKQLIAGLFGGLDRWLVALGIDTDQAWHLLRGMQADITIGHGPGYHVVQHPDGWVAMVADDIVARAATIDAVRQLAEANGHRRAYLRLRSIHGNYNTNCEALDHAVQALTEAGVTSVSRIY